MTTDFAEAAGPALELAGFTLSAKDAAVLAAVAQALEPGIGALEQADLRELPIESDLDPSRAPAPASATDVGSR